MRCLILPCLLLVACVIHAQQSKPVSGKEPVTQWTFVINQPIISSPVVSDGVAYFGGLDSTLYALDVATGKPKWTLKTRGEIRSTVAIHNGHVFLLGGNGILSCIDKNTGKIVWLKAFDNTAQFLAERRYDFADYYHSSPVVDDGLVYFGSGNGRFNAVRANNGEPVWTFTAGDIIHNTPVVHGSKVFFGSFDGHVYALHKATGELLWKFKSVGHRYFPRGEMQGSPRVAAGSVFIGSRDYNFYAIDEAQGHANWNVKFPYGWALSASVNDTTVYIGTSDDRVLVAVDPVSGAEKWRAALRFNIFGGCAFSPGVVYVGTLWGRLYALDSATGAVKWSFATKGHKQHHKNYFTADDSFRPDIGKILRSPVEWVAAEYKMGGMFSTPAISGNLLIVTTTEGIVYALKLG